MLGATGGLEDEYTDISEAPQGDASKRRPDNHMSNTFYDRIAKGNNLTKMGSGSNPRDVAMLIAAQARAPVDCPTLQAIGPQATNQAVKAIAIARTFLKESQSIDICMQPEFFQLEDGHSGLLLLLRKKQRRARSGEDEAQSLKAASGTDAKVLAGAISSFAREGRRMVVTGIGAAAINQVVKAIAIARKNIEDEAIDLTCKPEFTEVNEGVTALRMLLLVEQT
jgi:stage V sporulation protein S